MKPKQFLILQTKIHFFQKLKTSNSKFKSQNPNFLSNNKQIQTQENHFENWNKLIIKYIPKRMLKLKSLVIELFSSEQSYNIEIINLPNQSRDFNSYCLNNLTSQIIKS